MKYYKIEINGEDLYQKYKNDVDRFKWVKLPSYFKYDNYIVYFTMYGLYKFMDNDYEEFSKKWSRDDFDFIEIELENKDRKIVFSNGNYLVYKLKDELELIT